MWLVLRVDSIQEAAMKTTTRKRERKKRRGNFSSTTSSKLKSTFKFQVSHSTFANRDRYTQQTETNLHKVIDISAKVIFITILTLSATITINAEQLQSFGYLNINSTSKQALKTMTANEIQTMSNDIPSNNKSSGVQISSHNNKLIPGSDSSSSKWLSKNNWTMKKSVQQNRWPRHLIKWDINENTSQRDRVFDSFADPEIKSSLSSSVGMTITEEEENAGSEQITKKNSSNQIHINSLSIPSKLYEETSSMMARASSNSDQQHRKTTTNGESDLTQDQDQDQNQNENENQNSGRNLNESVSNDRAQELSTDQANSDYFRHSFTVSVIITIAYTIVFIVGIVGNSFVVAIVCKSPRMRTITNFFIVNLAFADILVLLFCLPATLVGNLFMPYVLGQFVCKSVSYLQGVAVSASIYTMVAVTMDRFLAICFPMDWHMSRRAARWTIACIWLFSLSIALPWFIYFTLLPYQLENGNNIEVCAEGWPSEKIGNLYFVCANLILLYLLPATVIILCYLGIWYKIERRNIPGDRPRGLKIELIMQKSKLKVVKMMVVVVVIFFFSWLPLYLIFARIKLAEERSQWEEWLITQMMPLAQWLGASNSCMNPILYTFFNRKYKQGFADLLRVGLRCGFGSKRSCRRENSACDMVLASPGINNSNNNLIGQANFVNSSSLLANTNITNKCQNRMRNNNVDGGNTNFRYVASSRQVKINSTQRFTKHCSITHGRLELCSNNNSINGVEYGRKIVTNREGIGFFNGTTPLSSDNTSSTNSAASTNIARTNSSALRYSNSSNINSNSNNNSSIGNNSGETSYIIPSTNNQLHQKHSLFVTQSQINTAPGKSLRVLRKSRRLFIIGDCPAKASQNNNSFNDKLNNNNNNNCDKFLPQMNSIETKQSSSVDEVGNSIVERNCRKKLHLHRIRAQSSSAVDIPDIRLITSTNSSKLSAPETAKQMLKFSSHLNNNSRRSVKQTTSSSSSDRQPSPRSTTLSRQTHQTLVCTCLVGDCIRNDFVRLKKRMSDRKLSLASASEKQQIFQHCREHCRTYKLKTSQHVEILPNNLGKVNNSEEERYIQCFEEGFVYEEENQIETSLGHDKAFKRRPLNPKSKRQRKQQQGIENHEQLEITKQKRRDNVKFVSKSSSNSKKQSKKKERDDKGGCSEGKPNATKTKIASTKTASKFTKIMKKNKFDDSNGNLHRSLKSNSTNTTRDTESTDITGVSSTNGTFATASSLGNNNLNDDHSPPIVIVDVNRPSSSSTTFDGGLLSDLFSTTTTAFAETTALEGRRLLQGEFPAGASNQMAAKFGVRTDSGLAVVETAVFINNSGNKNQDQRRRRASCGGVSLAFPANSVSRTSGQILANSTSNISSCCSEQLKLAHLAHQNRCNYDDRLNSDCESHLQFDSNLNLASSVTDNMDDEDNNLLCDEIVNYDATNLDIGVDYDTDQSENDDDEEDYDEEEDDDDEEDYDEYEYEDDDDDDDDEEMEVEVDIDIDDVEDLYQDNEVEEDDDNLYIDDSDNDSNMLFGSRHNSQTDLRKEKIELKKVNNKFSEGSEYIGLNLAASGSNLVNVVFHKLNPKEAKLGQQSIISAIGSGSGVKKEKLEKIQRNSPKDQTDNIQHIAPFGQQPARSNLNLSDPGTKTKLTSRDDASKTGKYIEAELPSLSSSQSNSNTDRTGGEIGTCNSQRFDLNSNAYLFDQNLPKLAKNLERENQKTTSSLNEDQGSTSFVTNSMMNESHCRKKDNYIQQTLIEANSTKGTGRAVEESSLLPSSSNKEQKLATKMEHARIIETSQNLDRKRNLNKKSDNQIHKAKSKNIVIHSNPISR